MTPSLLKVMAWLFLVAGVVGLTIGIAAYFLGGAPGEYGVMLIGGTFWLLCSVVAFFLRSRLP